ncbi:MAG TPA: ATP-binding protein [Bryobacteraceae bacterium]|nr:ATP-binding protein [Bryobacteraceae bacterium]
MVLRPRRVRARLTLWYVGLLSAVLSIYLAGVLSVAVWQMNRVLKRLASEDLETVKGLLYTRADGSLGLREEYHHHDTWKQAEERYLEVLGPKGAILFRNSRLGNRTLGGPPFPGEGESNYSGRAEKLSDGTRVVLVSGLYDLQEQRVLIRVAYSEELIWERLGETLSILAMALPLAIAGAAITSYKMAARALNPIERMAQQAQRINSERLNELLQVENPEDELGHLAAAFNAAFTRIEQSFEQLRRFTANASHELRTPLASIRCVGEVALQRDEGVAKYREAIGSMVEEVNYLTGLVESLLMLSRADAGQIPLRPSVFPLMKLLRETVGLLEVLIEEKKLALTIGGDEDGCVRADRQHLRQAAVNILHNAVKFTPVGGHLAVRVERQGDSWLQFSITDDGPGIPAEDATRVFERFYRCGDARLEGNATGLGLSIAQWAVRANSGEIGLTRPPAGGTTVWVRLPSVPCEPAA